MADVGIRPSSSVAPEIQVSYTKSGEAFVLHSCSGSLFKKYFAISNAFELKCWRSINDFPNAQRVQNVYNMERATLKFGMLKSGEYALAFRFPSLSSSSSSTCLSSRHKLTLVVKSRDQLRSWVRAVQVLFAGLDHYPCREGTVGGDECTICLSSFVDGELISFLPCKHRYHDDCIKQWLKRGAFCPNCKSPNIRFSDGSFNLSVGKFKKTD